MKALDCETFSIQKRSSGILKSSYRIFFREPYIKQRKNIKNKQSEK